MSATTINTKILLRTDTKENWESKNPVLKLGEIAIVCFENDYKDIKIGNGLSSFNSLSYLYQNEIKTDKITGKDLHVKSIAQGYNVKATPTSLATGIFSYADGNFDVVHGIEAKAKTGDDYAFVFNGINLPLDGLNFYQSHGEGSFNINPLSGLSGFYIGEQHLASIFNNYFLSNDISNYYDKSQINGIYLDLENKIIVVDNKLSDYYKKNETSSSNEISVSLNNKVKIGEYVDESYVLSSSDLSIVTIEADDYYTLVSEEKTDPNVVYILSSDNINAHGETIINVAEPILSDDATTKNYVDMSLLGRLLSTDISFAYDSTNKKINLKAFNGNIGQVDCTDFIKDGMLSSVELCGNIIVFKFNTDAGTTPISIDLSSFGGNYDEKISALSNAISTIGEDYLDSNDKLEIYNDLLSPNEVFLYKGPGQKDITLSVGTGTLLCTYTATLSDFYLNSETSSSNEISIAINSVNSIIATEVATRASKDEFLSNEILEVSNSLSDYYRKTETSSSNEISTAIASVENCKTILRIWSI